MNNIFIIYVINELFAKMAETLSPPSDRSTCTRTRRASVAAPDAWKAFKHMGAGADTRFQNRGGC